jgi:ABC-2 type transport system permease protein
MSIYNWEEKQNLAESFDIQRAGAVPGASQEKANGTSQSYPTPKLKGAGTGPTSHAKTSQFRKPGFTVARYGEQFSKGEMSARMRTAQVRLLPLGQAQTLHPRWYDDTMSLEKNVYPDSSAETDEVLDFVDSRKTMIVPVLEESIHPQATQKAAIPPYGQTRYTLATVTLQYMILLRVLLGEYRTTWFFHVFGGLLIPVSFAFFIVVVGGAGSSEKAIYLLGGNLALSIATGPASFLITRIGWARQSKEFHYWIALPVAKLILVLAILSVALLFALPGLLGIYVFGSLLFGFPFSGASWGLIPLVPLGVLPLAGVGALLGIFAKSGEIANIFSNILVVFVSVLSPVLLPFESLPVPLRILSQVMPTTYVADAFRAVLGGQGTHLALDLIILPIFSVVIMTITYFRLDWRNT